MYTIFADGQCIYNDISPSPEMKVVDPVLTLEDNAAGSLTLKLCPSNVGYSSVERVISRIVVKKDKKEIWEGRVISEKIDFWNNRDLTCEGELAYLNDTTQPPTDDGYLNPTPRSFLSAILAIHNSKVSSAKQFTLGTVTVNSPMINEDPEIDDEDEIYVFTNFESTLECIQQKLIEKLGGHLRIRKVNGVRYLDYLEDYPDTAAQTIEFRKNLVDFVKDYDQTEFATVIVPLGKAYDVTAYNGIDEYPTIEDVNGGKNYLKNDAAVWDFGWIEKVVHFDEAEEPEDLLEKAQEYMENLNLENLKLEVTALDLYYMDRTEEEITLLSEVRVISKPHNLDRYMPVTKLEIPLDKPSDTIFTLGGEVSSSLSSYTSKLAEDAARAWKETYQEAMNTNISLLNNAKENAASQINNATNGYITITKREETGTEELYISNTKDYKTAQKFWRWNMGGLGYSKDGGRTYEVAMTMDGSIVANFITTGTMSADRVRTGKLISSDANQNVIFDLTNGTLTMKNGSIDLGSGNFKVTDQGVLTMKKGSISLGSNFSVTDQGVLTMKKGSIDLGGGNFSVTDAGVLTIKKGSINLGNGNFTVTDAGVLTMKKGSIDLGSGNFKVTDEGVLTMKKGSINLGDGYFSVTDQGVLTMKKGSITLGSTFSVSDTGYLTATSGKIGGFTIDSSSIYNDMVGLYSDGLNVRGRNSISGVIANVGHLHANYMVKSSSSGGSYNTNLYGVSTSLNGFGSYIAWEARTASEEHQDPNHIYTFKLLYSQDTATGYGKDTLNVFCNTDFHNWKLNNAWIDPNSGGCSGGVNTLFIIPTDKGNFNLTFRNGMLTTATAPSDLYINL